MQYRNNNKNQSFSALGFGVMRLPRIKGSKEIDLDASYKMINYAYNAGINYFDTAYVYDGGKNEEILGEAVKEFRKNIIIATKLPVYNIRKYEHFDEYFYKSLNRLQTDYVDQYMLHSLLDYEQYRRLKQIGIDKWIKDKITSGEIKNIGFSFHGKIEDFKAIVDSYKWDFCQIQYNYWDINYQAGREGLLYAHNKNITIIAMEPLRGGAITDNQPKEALDIFNNYDKDRTLADWGLRWVYNHNEITVVLSGMSNLEQLKENIKITENANSNSLSKDELLCYEQARDAVLKKQRIPCTGCRYCMPCPYGVDIAGCFAAYNEVEVFNIKQKRGKYIASIGGLSDAPGFASLCKKCGACEKKCPQQIKIIESLRLVKRKLEFPFMKPALTVARKFIKR